MAIWKPLSLSEREALAKQLRKEAAEKIAEAERIEEGCKADYEVIDKAAKEAFERIATRAEK